MKRNNHPPTKEEFHLGQRVKYLATQHVDVLGECKYKSDFLISAYMENGFILDKYVLKTKNKKLIRTRYYAYFMKRFNQIEKKYKIKINRVN